jgi:hypothetical protein
LLPRETSIKQKLEERVADILGEDKESVKSQIEFEVMYWAPILQNLEIDRDRQKPSVLLQRSDVML